MQKHVNLVDLVMSFPMNIFLQNLASIQRRTSPIKFAHLAEKSEKASISNLSTKVVAVELQVFHASVREVSLRTLEHHRFIVLERARLCRNRNLHALVRQRVDALMPALTTGLGQLPDLPVFAMVLDRSCCMHLGDLYAESGQTLQGSFSAVSKPNFASKYSLELAICSLESSRRDLHNALLCTVLESIIEKWGKKDLAKTTPKIGENKKTRGQ